MEHARSNRLPRQFWLVAVCFLISGFAALLYETVWLRQFAILLGTSEQALAVVLASYMGGLAIGSLVASRVVDTVRRPLLTYGILEFGIAISALLVPVGLSFARSLQSSLFGGGDDLPSAGNPSQVIFCLATAFTLILVPTGFMGATLPLLARHVVSRDEQLGPRIGLLYAINTAGAVVGTLTAAFVCLPSFGLGRTTWIGAACNLIVFVLVLIAVRQWSDFREPGTAGTSPKDSTPQVAERPAEKKQKRKRPARKPRESSANDGDLSGQTRAPAYKMILLFAAISGGVSFCYEIIFTRMLSHMLGGSVFAFATMLAGFLLGIALGGGIAARLATSRDAAAKVFVYAQSATAVSALFAFHLIDRMSGWQWQTLGGANNTMVQIVASIFALLPTATCIGASFPLAIRVYARDQSDAASGAARVYGWNVVGAIAGSLATGAIVLPLLQYQGATALAVLGNLLIAGGVMLTIRLPAVHYLAIAAAVVGLAVGLPTEPENVIRAQALSGAAVSGEVIYNHVGKSATVTVFYDKGEIRFQTNGLPESTLAAMGSGDRHRNTGVWLSALPPLIRPQAESMLIIGLGGGVAAERVAPSIKSIDVIELEAAVVSANQRVANLRDYDPLSDPRVKIVLNDGRNALTLTSKRYDIIVSQPSHPWTAGASHLYTREFNRLVLDHLNPGGVFLQWMNSEFVDRELVSAMAFTLRDVFPHVRLYQPIRGTFMFVASAQPMRPEQVPPNGNSTLCEMAEVNRDYFRRLGVVSPTHLLSMLTLDQQGIEAISSDAELITDERNLLAMRAPKLIRGYDGSSAEQFVAQHAPYSRATDELKSLCPSLDRVVLARSMTRRDERESVLKYLVRQSSDPLEAALIENDVLRVTRSADQWIQHLRSSLQRFPDSGDFAYLTLTNSLFSTSNTLSEAEIERLKALLSEQQRMVVELIEAMKQNDFAALQQADQRLAMVPLDDVAFEMAVRLRIPWRLEAPPDQRVMRGREALNIIDATAPFSNSSGLAYFRTMAAINGNRPLVALGTATRIARAIQLSMADEDQPLDQAAVANLQRISMAIRSPTVLKSVPRWRYQETVFLVDSVLQQLDSFQ